MTDPALGGLSARPLAALAALLVATSPDVGRDGLERAKNALRDRYHSDPMETVVSAVALCAALFYRAEKGKNPKVRSFWDALVFVSTSVSAGYCDVVAVTPTGKAISSALMTFGPAMASGIMAPPRASNAADADARIVERLDKILRALSPAERAVGHYEAGVKR